MSKDNKFRQTRPWWFRVIKKITKIKYKKPEFVYLGEKPTNGAIIISNHEGTDAPMSLEIYADYPVRFWGTAEMNSGLRKMYKYQSEVYYHSKKHWSLFAARAFCLIASPITNIFYKGLNLISTYTDINLRRTFSESIEALKSGDNVVIFPEKSDEGYLAELKGFYCGFLMLARLCYDRGMDVPIFVSYYKKKENVYVFDTPILYSELKKQYQTRDAMAEYLIDRCNSLGNSSDTVKKPGIAA